MTMFRISSYQLFVLMVLSQIGSAIVLGIGLEAKQDAWLAIIIAMIAGMLLFQVYSYLFHSYPKLTLPQLLEKIVGKIIGRTLTILYVAYFFYIAARVLRDFGELLVTSLLPGTPILVVILLISFVVFYTCISGIEVLARVGEILFPYMMLWGFLFVILLVVGDLPDTTKIQPILENGWGAIFKAAFPTILTFPFGETIIFLIILNSVKDKKQATRMATFSILISGVTLTTITFMNLAVLGPTLASMENFPLLETLAKVNVGDFLQRLDPIAVSMLVVGGYFKITIFFCLSLQGLKDLVTITFPKWLEFVFIALLVVTSMSIADSYVEHINFGLNIVPKYIHVPFQIIIPCLLAVIVYTKEKMNKKKQKS